MNYLVKLFHFAVIYLLIVLITGCQSLSKPRFRIGAYFGTPFGISYPDPEHLGKHGYTNGWSERNGLVYTYRGGFIDIGHLRDSADRTAYCTNVILEKIMNGETEFSFKLQEPSVYFVTISYPDNWGTLPDKEKIAKETASELGRYFAFTAVVWHEIITWYGYKCTGLFSEYVSAFSCEDIYSDVVGINIAAEALKNETYAFNDAMTMLIDKELQELNVRPVNTVKSAVQRIKGHWYKGGTYPFVSLKKRNLDIGLDDNFVTPWLVPGICENCEPQLSPVPQIDSPNRHGFSVNLEIKPGILESYKILRLIYPNGEGKFVNPPKHFPVIMEYINKIEIEKYGPKVLVPEF
jgi:hypothetical protein